MVRFETEKAMIKLINYVNREGLLRIEGLSWITAVGEIDVDIEITYEDDLKITAYDQETNEIVAIDFNKYPMCWSEVDLEIYEIV